MERLTFSKEFAEAEGIVRDEPKYIKPELAIKAYVRLAAYEDTGLTPGDVKDLQALSKENGYVYANTLESFPEYELVERGKWIQHHEETSDNELMAYGWECSLCGRWEMEKQPFCNCGARMAAQKGDSK